MRISNHAKRRIVQRTEDLSYICEAKRKAKIAYEKGHNIGYYRNNPRFYNYLSSLVHTNTTKIRVYDNLIYVFKGKNNTLVTAHQFPNFMKEVKM